MLGIERYYAGKTLFVTGATGLVGKVLLEAILRKLPAVGRIYVLIRPPREVGEERDGHELRLRDEILASSAFDHLRALHGEDFDAFVERRLVAVRGDLSQERLGIDEDVYQRLLGEVDLVIHSGALAVFEAPLHEALEVNTLGPSRVLELARAARKRPFVAHLSTCYVNNAAGPIFETDLDPRATPNGPAAGEPYDVEDEIEAMRAFIRTVEPERLVRAGRRWARRRGWHDVYTLTKAMGEQLFVRRKGEVQALILRPSIIESSLRTPAPGWIDGFRMVDPILVGFGRGQIFDFPGNPEGILDVVPADVVVDALLAAIPWTHVGEGPPVYHVASGMESPLVLKEFQVHAREYFAKAPLRRDADGNAKALPEWTFPAVESFLRRLDLRYLLPLRIGEWLLAPLGATPWGAGRSATLGYRRSRLERLRNLADIYGPYAESRARFLTFNVRALWDELSDSEREQFQFLLQGLDWKSYVQAVHVPGIERYLLRRRRGAAGTVAPQAVPLVRGSAARTMARGENGNGAHATAEGTGRGRRAGSSWRRAEKLLALTRELEPDAVSRWTTPVYKKLMQRASARVVRLICRYHLSLETSGEEHIPERGPFIVVANHTSHVDTGVLMAALRRHGTHVHPTAATDYWFKKPLLGWFLHATLGAIPFARHAHSIPRALALPAEVLRKGHSLIFYPEGERSPDGRMKPFKSTVGLLALASGASLLPVHIQGAYEALPKGASAIRHRPVRVRFGPVTPIASYLERLDSLGVSALARQIARDAEAAVASLGPEPAPV